AMALGVGDRVEAALLGAVAAVKHPPGDPEERLHENRVLVVVIETAVHGLAAEGAAELVLLDVLAQLGEPLPVLLAGLEVVALVAGHADRLAGGQKQRQAAGKEEERQAEARSEAQPGCADERVFDDSSRRRCRRGRRSRLVGWTRGIGTASLRCLDRIWRR